MPTKKKYNARFAPARIKKIMQTDEEVGKVSAAVPVLISKALEMFLDEMMKKADQLTSSRNAKTLTVKHLKQCIMTEKRFDFLHDTVSDVPDLGPEEEEEEKQPRKRRKQSEQKSTSNGKKVSDRVGEHHSSEGDQPDDVFTALIAGQSEEPCSSNNNLPRLSTPSTPTLHTPTTPSSKVKSFSIDSIMNHTPFPDLPGPKTEPKRVKTEPRSEVKLELKLEPKTEHKIVPKVESKSVVSDDDDYDA